MPAFSFAHMYIAGIMSAVHSATMRHFDDSSLSMSVDLSSSVMMYSRQLLESAGIAIIMRFQREMMSVLDVYTGAKIIEELVSELS